MASEFGDLVAAASEGDASAIEELYHRYSAPVLGAVRRRLTVEMRRRQDSMDIAQSVFADVLRVLPRFEDRGEPAFRHWLYLKVENKLRDKLRRDLGRGGRRREMLLGSSSKLVGETQTPSKDVAADEERARVRELIDDLPAEQQEVVRLRLEDGLKFREIADRLGLPSADAARMKFARCLRKMRRRWSVDGDAAPGP